jgi:hypothetical protein
MRSLDRDIGSHYCAPQLRRWTRVRSLSCSSSGRLHAIRWIATAHKAQVQQIIWLEYQPSGDGGRNTLAPHPHPTHAPAIASILVAIVAVCQRNLPPHTRAARNTYPHCTVVRMSQRNIGNFSRFVGALT